jgi:heptaprenyl diphosphate synthase
MGSRADAFRARLRRLVLTSLFGAAAMALSYAEHLVPLPLPLPGVRLGLSNIAVVAAAAFLSPLAGAAVAALKILVPLLMSGNGIAFLFSLSGTALSYATVLLAGRLAGKRISYAGACCASAGAHCCGQLAAAALVAGTSAVIGYLPVMLAASAVTGTATGIILNLCAPALGGLAEKYREGKPL